ncbi:hypothetical protein [Neptuniibacter sp. QD37_11]|uniref:hypothetical protein n=1 Tax=Neptuniibacter sp. QD37_11 TaxID=3398209 RepID=UPI0039F45C75
MKNPECGNPVDPESLKCNSCGQSDCDDVTEGEKIGFWAAIVFMLCCFAGTAFMYIDFTDQTDEEANLRAQALARMSIRESLLLPDLFEGMEYTMYYPRLGYRHYNPFRDAVNRHLVKTRKTAPAGTDYFFCSAQDQQWIKSFMSHGEFYGPNIWGAQNTILETINQHCAN